MKMRELIRDAYVCRPEVSISPSLGRVSVHFELLDIDTNQGTGKRHAVAMTAEDAMWLLRHLQNLQTQFALEVPEGELVQLNLDPKRAN